MLVKGGHLGGDYAEDVLFDGADARVLRAGRVDTKNTHGTGCTLSSAIAAQLAKGQSLFEATASAKDYLTAALKAADQLQVGSGHGPVHHFHGLWR